jgi:hypothetical protein
MEKLGGGVYPGQTRPVYQPAGRGAEAIFKVTCYHTKKPPATSRGLFSLISVIQYQEHRLSSWTLHLKRYSGLTGRLPAAIRVPMEVPGVVTCIVGTIFFNLAPDRLGPGHGRVILTSLPASVIGQYYPVPSPGLSRAGHRQPPVSNAWRGLRPRLSENYPVRGLS